MLAIPSSRRVRRPLALHAELLTAVEENHAISWPFLKPVDPQLALDYYDVIIDPIDLSLMRSRLGCGQYYLSLEMFVADMRKMCDNCRWAGFGACCCLAGVVAGLTASTSAWRLHDLG